jgi:hypothetical protein
MSKILDCQQRIADLLNADARPANIAPENWPPIFSDPDPAKKVEAITQRKGNIQSEIQQKLIKIGVGAIVMLPLITWEGDGNRISLGMKFAVVITENPTVNLGSSGTKKSAEAIVERTIQLLHWKPNSSTSSGRAVPGLFQVDRNAVRMMETPPGQQLVNYIVAINTSITLQT